MASPKLAVTTRSSPNVLTCPTEHVEGVGVVVEHPPVNQIPTNQINFLGYSIAGQVSRTRAGGDDATRPRSPAIGEQPVDLGAPVDVFGGPARCLHLAPARGDRLGYGGTSSVRISSPIRSRSQLAIAGLVPSVDTATLVAAAGDGGEDDRASTGRSARMDRRCSTRRGVGGHGRVDVGDAGRRDDEPHAFEVGRLVCPAHDRSDCGCVELWIDVGATTRTTAPASACSGLRAPRPAPTTSTTTSRTSR